MLGLDPGAPGLTLRKLLVMLRAKREHDGFLATWTAAVVVAHLPFTASQIDPAQMNPFREIDPRLEAEREKVKRYIAGEKLKAWARALAEEQAAKGG